MSWRYGNKRRNGKGSEDENRKSTDDSFFDDPFNFNFSFGFQGIDDMLDSMFKTAERMGGDVSNNPNSVYYGYQVNVGPDGKPHVREFGNVKPTRRGTFEPLGSREPFVDVVVDEKDNAVKVVAEMPGIQKEDIKIEGTEDSLSITAQNKDRNYNTTVPLSQPVDPNSARASYKNGILEVKLQLKHPPKPKGTSIRVD